MYRKANNWMWAAALLAVVSMSSQAAYVVTRQGNRVDGTDIRVRPNGDVVLTTSIGQQTFPAGTYMRAVADQPAEYDQARQLMSGGQYDRAIPLLKEIVRAYANLDWDMRALGLLAQASYLSGDYTGAVRSYEDLFEKMPKDEVNSEMLWNYRESLLKADRLDKLELLLNELIESGARDDAARAQVMRGDIKKSRNQLKDAVLDYMRTVILFKNAAEEIVAEAAFKAGETLEAQRDSRAKDMFRIVVEQYPGSPFAAQAGQKL